MRVCMVTSQLPPVQAATALLPVSLADELRRDGVTTDFVSHPATAAIHPARLPHGAVAYVPRRAVGPVGRSLIGAAVAGGRIAMGVSGSVARADLIHLHSNGLIVEAASMVARWRRKPQVLTLYGTDIWHHRADRHRRFGRLVRDVAHRVFYSQALLDHARQMGLAPDPSSVIYAPLQDTFRAVEEAERSALRQRLELGDGPLLLTVKRLHSVAGYHDLIRAMPVILKRFPDARLLIAGAGELRRELETLVARLHLSAAVQFLGLAPLQDTFRAVLTIVSCGSTTQRPTCLCSHPISSPGGASCSRRSGVERG